MQPLPRVGMKNSGREAAGISWSAPKYFYSYSIFIKAMAMGFQRGVWRTPRDPRPLVLPRSVGAAPGLMRHGQIWTERPRDPVPFSGPPSARGRSRWEHGLPVSICAGGCDDRRHKAHAGMWFHHCFKLSP